MGLKGASIAERGFSRTAKPPRTGELPQTWARGQHSRPRALSNHTRLVADADPARCRFRLLRNRNFQNTVLAACADALGIGAVGKREATIERAIRTFHARRLATVSYTHLRAHETPE